ncbi:MAG: hypothetical protein AM1032_000143 [Mycoplasmataceae bacterium]|nr:MAG: hypothetical protein AM1032_000143 [Mycoplasmataceae bacterium]
MAKDKKIKRIKSDFYFVNDWVNKIAISKIYHKNSAFYGNTIWTLHCKKNTIKILECHLKNKDFLEKLKNDEQLNILKKKFKFTISQRGKYLIKAEEIIDNN